MFIRTCFIASVTDVGAPVGLALMVAGTLCTAYSCGLFDFDSNGNYVGGTTENLISFGVFMGLNFVGGGVAGSTARSAFKSSGSEVMQIASRNAVVDSRGLYASTITRKYVVSPGSVETAEKYVVEEQFGSEVQEQAKRILIDIAKDMATGWIWNNRFTIFNTFKYQLNRW